VKKEKDMTEREEGNKRMINIAKSFFFESPTTHEELLGDFKENYLGHRDFVRSSIYWMVNSNVVDDLVQETFLRAWKSFHKFEKKSSFRTWIYRIARNVTYDYFNKNESSYNIFDENNMEGKNENVELSDLISKGLLSLTVNQRELFTLHYQQGFSYREIAEFVGIAEGTVKSRVHNAKKIFVKFLEKNGVKDG